MSLKSMNIDKIMDLHDKIKDPCDNKHTNPCKSSPCHFICVFVVVNACGSVRLDGLSPLFKCPYVCLFVCLCTRLFESMLMLTLECTTTKETLENSFINTEID